MQVIKRDGIKKQYDNSRVVNAIKKAFDDVYKENDNTYIANKIGLDVLKTVNEKFEDEIEIENIQDIVVDKIKEVDKSVAKSYKEYRDKRTSVREKGFYKWYVDNVINKISTENSNANVDENNFGGKEGRIVEDILEHACDIVIEENLGEKILNDTKTCIKIHDKSKFVLGMHNCLLLPYRDMIYSNGINTRQGDTKPTKNYNTACHLIPVAIQSQSLDMFGGCGLMNFSIYMVDALKNSITHFVNDVIDMCDLNIPIQTQPIKFKEARNLLGEKYYGKFKKRIDKDTENANQALITNLVTLQSRSGHQLPFSSINLGLIDPENKEESAYIIEMFLKEIDKGIGKKDRTAIFPITIFQVKGGVNRYPNDEFYYLRMYAQEVSHRRLYPTFVNCDFSHNIVTSWESEMNMMGKQLLLM